MIQQILSSSSGPVKKQNFAAPRNLRGELEKFYQKPVAKVSLELIFTLVTVLFFAVFALRPTLTTMAELTREIEDKTRVNEELTKKVTSLATAQAEYVQYEQRFEILEEAIHDEPTLETALFYLEYLVRRENISLSGLRIETFPIGRLSTSLPSTDTPQPTSPGVSENSEIGVYAIQASFEGDYTNILAFFEALESVRPLFSVQAFNFSVNTNRDRETILKTNVTIYMYGSQAVTTPAPRPRTYLKRVYPSRLEELVLLKCDELFAWRGKPSKELHG